SARISTSAGNVNLRYNPCLEIRGQEQLPVFAMLANVSGAPLMLTALALLFSNSYGGMVTHYGGAAGPVIFGVGYNDIKSWWLVGAVLTILTFLVHITLGVWWWNMLIGWNML
ncbi:anion permease, partial [Escherichia coli]|uniref:anion permease n=1 Tax=Escherichia coli TaxID=562 RepID=UPI002023A686